MLLGLRRAIESAVASLVAGKGGATGRGGDIVDLGAGAAPYRDLFLGHGYTYVACDLAGEDGTSPAADHLIVPGEPVDLAEGMAAFVVSFQVLEHVWDLDWYLGECRRLLAPGGKLILSTHGVWLFHPHPTDYRRWTRDGLVKELEVRGFHVESIQGVVGPLAWTTQFRALGYHHVLTQIPVVGRLLSAVLCTFMNLRMWAEDAATPAAQVQSNAAVYLLVASDAHPSAPVG